MATTKSPKTQFKRIPIHALSAGTWYGLHGPVALTEADIAEIAENYNPERHEAPVVIGHPARDAPAYGWIAKAEARADGLWLSTDLLPAMADVVEQGLFKKVSVSLYPPDSPHNPAPGVYSVKHLGFLGAQPPAVKGLQAIGLSEEQHQILILNFEEAPMGDHNKDKAATKDKPIELSENKLTERESAISLAEANLAKRLQAVRRSELEAKLTPHINAGRVLPVHKPLLLALAEHCDEQTVELSEGKAESLLDAFDQFLAKLPPQIELTELAAPDTAVKTQAVNFSTPDGFDVDAAQLALHKKAEAHLAANPSLTYIQAFQAVQTGV